MLRVGLPPADRGLHPVRCLSTCRAPEGEHLHQSEEADREYRPPDIAPLEHVRFRGQEAGATFVVLRWAGVPGKARPMSGGERTAKRSRSRVPGKAVTVSLRSSQRACAARVRCGELKGRQGDLQLLLSAFSGPK